MRPLTIRPLTPELFPALEAVLGPSGARGCCCMYWRIGAAYRRRPPEANREALREVVAEGSPPGLLAFDGDTPVGWCQVTPRAAIPEIERQWRLRTVDDAPVWSISCLYVRQGYRRQGITAVLIEAALQAAKRAGAPALEGYPFDRRHSPSATGTGVATTYERLGFREVARHVPARPIMRHDLEGV